MNTSVTAVVVAYNRRELLLDCLSALAAQTHPLARILVVDNASTDGSGAAARAHAAHPDVVTLSQNTGGAGGFAAGLALALAGAPAEDPAYVWLMDDDTIPTPPALEELLHSAEAWAELNHGGAPAILSSKAVWTDGRAHPMNTPRERPFCTPAQRRLAAAAGGMPIRSASFVSQLVLSAAVREEGLPVADYFIWNDDFEFSARLLRTRAGLWVPGSVVEHRTAYFGSTDRDPGERFRFEIRNKIWLFRASPALRGKDRLLYGASTVARWMRTFGRSQNRRVLCTALLRGLREGLTSLPRPNSARFAGVRPAEVGEAMQRLEHPSIRATPLDPAQFTVLLPVYAGDRPEWFLAALTSATARQTLRPAEVVIVRDGPVGPELQTALDEAPGQTGGVPVRVIPLARNTGLPGALNAGLEACRTEAVARQDADDLSLPNRFERLIPHLADHDLVGSAVQEFTTGADGSPVPGMVRSTPRTASGIREGAALASPFHHPSVAYRRSAVLRAGGYPRLPSMEDYALWAAMLGTGAVAENLPEVLVLYRVDAGSYARRGGWRLLRSEVAMQRRLRGLGLTTPLQEARNLLVRGGYRLVPERTRRAAYRAWQRTRARHPRSNG